MASIAWTPPHDLTGLASVMMEQPTEPLTIRKHRDLLAARIDRMVAKETEEEARRLLEVVEEREVRVELMMVLILVLAIQVEQVELKLMEE